MSSPNIQQLSVVIPMYNEVDNVEPLIREVMHVLAKLLDYEVVVVNDGSKDGTLEKLHALALTIPELTVINHQGNFGQSASVVTGVRKARFDWIATMDGDGQNDPASLPAMIAKAGDPLTLIAGHRTKRKDTWFKRLSSKIANGVRGGLLGDNCPDTGCGLKLFNRAIFLHLPHFNHLHRFLPALYLRQGGKVVMVPVNHRPRTQGQSKYGLHNRLWVGITDMIGVMWLMRRPCNPVVKSSADE